MAELGLQATDMLAGINTGLYSNIWRGGIPSTTAIFLKNMTKWNWVRQLGHAHICTFPGCAFSEVDARSMPFTD